VRNIDALKEIRICVMITTGINRKNIAPEMFESKMHMYIINSSNAITMILKMIRKSNLVFEMRKPV